MKKAHQIIAGIALPFAIAGGMALDKAYEENQIDTLRQKYDREVIPALLQATLNICGDTDAKMHGLLAAKFIYDSNADDDVRKFLKSYSVDPHHYGSRELPGGDGYLDIKNAHKLAAYLLKENISITAEVDRHKGKYQVEYLNDGTGNGRMVFYFQRLPSDYDGKNKPWIPEAHKKIPADGIYVPMSPALTTFLTDLMNGKFTDVAVYRVVKKPGTDDAWEIDIKKLVMDGPAAAGLPGAAPRP